MKTSLKIHTPVISMLETRWVGEQDSGVFDSPAGPDRWREDLTIYRQGELVIGLVSHEQEGVLRLTPQEHGVVAGLDIRSARNPFH